MAVAEAVIESVKNADRTRRERIAIIPALAKPISLKIGRTTLST